MTQPADPGFATPPLVVDAAPINYTAMGGLYSATTPITLDDPARLTAGVQVLETNIAYSVASWDASCEAENPDKAGICVPLSDRFPAVVIVTAAEDSLVAGAEGGEIDRAEYGMRLAEEQQVEEAFAERLITDAGSPTDAADDEAIVVAVGALEQAVREQRLPVVLHAPVRFAALAASKGLVVKANATGRLQTPLGSTWVFGSGYGELGSVLVGTGPVTVRRSPVFSAEQVATGQNSRFGMAEREVVASYEGIAVAHGV